MGKDEKAKSNGQEGNTLRERRFSARAEQMLRSAQAAALELGHGYVGCEHLLLAMLLLLGARITIAHYVDTAFCSGLLNFLAMTAYMSVGLGLFNLIPISPLDGSKVLFAFLPDRAYMTLMRYEKYGMLVLFVLVWLGVGNNILSEGIYRVYELLVNWIVY